METSVFIQPLLTIYSGLIPEGIVNLKPEHFPCQFPQPDFPVKFPRFT